MNPCIKVAAAVPSVKIADSAANAASIAELCARMDAAGVAVAVFPEMCITGYTCGDLFHNDTLIDDAREAVLTLARQSKEWKTVAIVGLPLRVGGALYNVAAVVATGRVHGFVPKTYIPNYKEFYEKRWWNSGAGVETRVVLQGKEEILLSANQLFKIGDVTFGIEICEDLWTPIPPSSFATLAGAEIVFNLSATDALVGKYDYLHDLVKNQSARCISGYVYASAGAGESSTDLVFTGCALISANGRVEAEGRRWQDKPFYVDGLIDLQTLRHDRVTMSSFTDCSRLNHTNYTIVEIDGAIADSRLVAEYPRHPFVPGAKETADRNLDEIVNIQTHGLMQRLQATGTRDVVIGVSGGLDSTLALLVCVDTFDRMGLDRKGIHAITMPGFGTTDRTCDNATRLIEKLGTSFRRISIADAVNQHFSDIGHSPDVKDVTYENSQARQRTLLLMDIANQVRGMVVGTGDLSELALGWATYNGDHMSMYGLNAGVPKTLVRWLIEHMAERTFGAETGIPAILNDIIDTPVSPELIPATDDGKIAQKTEELVGPYELHDFFLYHILRHGAGPALIFERANVAFAGRYDRATILKWLGTFVRRFFAQQFKRSCLPDGPKVGSVCLSPRGDWRMPSDASAAAWLRDLQNLEDCEINTTFAHH